MTGGEREGAGPHGAEVIFDRALLERLLREDVASLADPAAIAEVGLEELSYVALERAGLLRRIGPLPEDLEGALADERTIGAALRFLSDLSLEDRLETFLSRAGKLDGQGAAGGAEADGALDPLESPEHEDEAETLFLHRDRVEAALCEIARRLPDGPEPRARLARILAGLARFDERFRANLHEFFAVLPLIEALRKRFDYERLDRATYWWWWEIEEAFRRLDSGPSSLDALAAEAHSGDRCVEGLDDVGWLRAAYATGETFEGRNAFAEHILRCPPCRSAVGELEALFARPEPARLGLAAAPSAEVAAEELRARIFRPRARIAGTAFFVAIGLKEADRLRFTFHAEGAPGRTRALDGGEVAIEGIGRATIEDGAAEIPLSRDRPPEEAVSEALRARRTLLLPDGSMAELP